MRMPANPAIERSAQQRRCWVPSALRAPEPAHGERLDTSFETEVTHRAIR